MLISQALPEVNWSEMTIGVALIVGVVFVTLIIAGLVWKFLPKMLESWNGMVESLREIAATIKTHIEKMETDRRETGAMRDRHFVQMDRMEHSIERLHSRLDTREARP